MASYFVITIIDVDNPDVTSSEEAVAVVEEIMARAKASDERFAELGGRGRWSYEVRPEGTGELP